MSVKKSALYIDTNDTVFVAENVLIKVHYLKAFSWSRLLKELALGTEGAPGLGTMSTG